MDPGWWLFCDKFAELTYSTPRLDGLGDRAETCAHWTARTGIATDGIEWYEVFAGFRMSQHRLSNARQILDEIRSRTASST